MRNRFTEWISQGIAAFKHTRLTQEVPEQDPICRLYNNIFSIPSDTHMSCLEDGTRVITGHMINTQQWDNFSCASSWGAICFGDSVNKRYWNLCYFLSEHKLKGQIETLNGDIVYRIYPVPEEEYTQCCPCVCPSFCVTSESKIPQPVSVLSINGSKIHILECFTKINNKYDVVNKMNESFNVKGNDWFLYNNKIYGVVDDKLYIL